MRNSFFKRRPQAGFPISMDGLADGLAAMDKALTRMSVEGGRVSWSGDGVPKIVIEQTETLGFPWGSRWPFGFEFTDASTFVLWNCFMTVMRTHQTTDGSSITTVTTPDFTPWTHGYITNYSQVDVSAMEGYWGVAIQGDYDDLTDFTKNYLVALDTVTPFSYSQLYTPAGYPVTSTNPFRMPIAIFEGKKLIRDFIHSHVLLTVNTSA
jgi:hypothetical protein